MTKARLLVVEDDADIANMLKLYFTGLGYQVDTAARGSDGLEKTRQAMPHLVILDILLPDIDGYEVCRRFRTSTRTSHIPVIFLTQKDERSDRLQGLELGADDYITKPFDIDELRLRVQNALARSERERLSDPQTGLPAGRLIEDQLNRIIRRPDWALMDIRVNFFEAFRSVYGAAAANDVLRFSALLLGELIDEPGGRSLQPGDFLGHAGGGNFIAVTTQDRAWMVKDRLKTRFAVEIQPFYSLPDQQKGAILVEDEAGRMVETPLMTLSVGIVSAGQQVFTDIRQITELAADARRLDAAQQTTR
jgi:DNA-binding response OmpR family regulator